MAKVHLYRASCSWEGSTALGYERYPRQHTLTLPPATDGLQLSSDPAFHGDPALPNPEQLLLAAAVSCQLLSFLAVASRARLDVRRYQDRGEAEMSEEQSPLRVSRIRLRPHIELARGDKEVSGDRLRQLVDLAHRECFIANSLKSEMTIEPTWVWGD